MISNKYLNNEHSVKFFLFLLTVAIYSSVLSNSFTAGDDQWMLLGDNDVKTISFDTIRHSFSVFKNGQYSPLNTLFYSLVYKIGGFNAMYFHALSLLGHCVNSILVYIFVRKLFLTYPNCRNLSVFTAILFCVHPIQVEAVAWISASKVILFSTFYLLALCAYINYVNTPTLFKYLVVFILFILSVLIKEQAILLPFSILLIDYFLKKKWFFMGILDKTPFFVIAIIYGIIIINENDSLHDSNYYSLTQTFILASWCFITYLILLLLPFRFMANEAFPVNTGQFWHGKYMLFVLLTLTFISLLVIAIVYRNKATVLGIGFWLLNILLVLNLIPMSRPAVIANRYIYISSVGIFIFAVNMIEKHKRSNLLRYVLISFIVSMSYISHQEIITWGKTNTIIFKGKSR